MRAVVQRVTSARVLIGGKESASIAPGLVVLLGIAKGDGHAEIEWMADKLIGLRVFEDDEGKLNCAVVDVEGELLIVSNFTVYGSVDKGKRPSFDKSASFEEGLAVYSQLLTKLESGGIPCRSGEYGADMLVEIQNDGPVMLVIDTPSRTPS